MPNANFIIAVARKGGFVQWTHSRKIERLTLELNSRGEEVVYATGESGRHVLHLKTGNGKLRNDWKCIQVAESFAARQVWRRLGAPLREVFPTFPE